MAIYPGVPKILHLPGRECLRISGRGFPMGWMCFLTPNHQCRALQGTQSTNHNQWSGLILYSSTT